MNFTKYTIIILVTLGLGLSGVWFSRHTKLEVKKTETEVSKGLLATSTDSQIVSTTSVAVAIKKTLPSSGVSKPLTPCASGSYDFSCYMDYYTRLVKEKGVDVAFADLKKAYDTNTYVRSQCHPLTHVIGHAAAQLYTNVSEAYKHGDAGCRSGYYHVVMAELVNKVGMDKIVGKLDSMCIGIPDKYTSSFDYYNCVHGL